MQDKKTVIDAIRRVMEQDDRLVFAYLYGSFTREEPHRDIDIGVYCVAPDPNPYLLSADLKERISENLRDSGIELPADSFDLQILNQAPFTFLLRIFTEGTLLLDRDPGLRTDLVEGVSRKYRECAGLLREAAIL